MANNKNQYPHIICSEETIETLHKWMHQFKNVYGYDFTYEDVILRALECLPLAELDVADAYRKQELEWKHQRELEETHINKHLSV